MHVCDYVCVSEPESVAGLELKPLSVAKGAHGCVGGEVGRSAGRQPHGLGGFRVKLRRACCVGSSRGEEIAEERTRRLLELR